MDDQMLIQELRKLYRGLEMSAGLMRDRSRTGGWSGAERTAAAFARYAATAQSLHALVSARASLAATIPATGHAATVDPDDLRPWGYAPGEYVFRCRDCPADPPFEQRPIGDKRSWRCKPHAEAARDASGHAATEGEGA